MFNLLQNREILANKQTDNLTNSEYQLDLYNE